jgi:Zn-dependent protease
VSTPDPYGEYRFEEPERDYRPVHPEPAWRSLLRMIWAPIALIVGLVAKFGLATFKFFGIFLSVGGYALIWGWSFAVGFVLLILVHELGHFVEARRQGLNPALPVFIPFLGAYVAIKDAPFDPWRNLKISAAGPIAGGLGALAVWIAGDVTDSRLLLALAYTGFFLNLLNLLPVPPLDGGFMWQALKVLRAGGGEPTPQRARGRAVLGGILYGTLVVALIAGMVGAHVPQDRL